MDVALKVRPAFPGTAVETKGVLEGPNAPLDPGPEAFELFVDPTGTHHALDRQPTLLEKATSCTPCSLAQLRLAAEAKPPSQALWRGTFPYSCR